MAAQENSTAQFSFTDLNSLLVKKESIGSETQDVIDLLGYVNEPENYRVAISKISQLPTSELSSVVPAVFYLFWSTPVFKKQVELINFIFESTPILFHALFVHYVILNFDKIETDRKDKFFYLLKKKYELLSFNYILNIENVEVLGFILSLLNRQFKGWNDEDFISFIIECKPYLLQSIKDIKIEEKIVRKNLDRTKNPTKLEALYKLFKE